MMLLRCIFLLSISHFSLFVYCENESYENSLNSFGNRGDRDENFNRYIPERNNRENQRHRNNGRENNRLTRPTDATNYENNVISTGSSDPSYPISPERNNRENRRDRNNRRGENNRLVRPEETNDEYNVISTESSGPSYTISSERNNRRDRNNRRGENNRLVRPEETNNDNNEISSGGRQTEYTYEDQQNWRKVSATCAGKSQSPIDITEPVKRNTKLQSDLRFGYKRGATLENTGHSAQLSFDEKNITFSGAAANSETYRLQQLHFHWGANDDEGSEHGLFGQKFSAEMHFVFYNTKYRNFTSAAGRKDGLTVLGVFLQASSRDNDNFASIVNGLRNIRQAESKTRIDVEIEKLLPKSEDIYYRYFGSLTTPPCSEVVNWIVFQTPIRIGVNQLRNFRELEDSKGNKQTTNWRYIQSRNGRSIESSAPKY